MIWVTSLLMLIAVVLAIIAANTAAINENLRNLRKEIVYMNNQNSLRSKAGLK